MTLIAHSSEHSSRTPWERSVPGQVLNRLSKAERNRQEAIRELVDTERDFVHDMKYIRDVWIKPLRTSDAIEEQRRKLLVNELFWNILDILAVNRRLCDALSNRQKGNPVVERIGDILLEFAPQLFPFVTYGSHQLLAKVAYDEEKKNSPAFSQFVQAAQRLPESRKLDLHGFLTKPTTRLGRYPLLLREILAHTRAGSPDATDITNAIAIIRDLLIQLNQETGKTENRYTLSQLAKQRMVSPTGILVDLSLNDQHRELLYKGSMYREGGADVRVLEDLRVYVFDHALLMATPKSSVQDERLEVSYKPIPLQLLVATAADGLRRRNSLSAARSRSGWRKSLGRTTPESLAPIVGSAGGYPVTFTYLGRNGYSVTLWARTKKDQKECLDIVQERQTRSAMFHAVTLSMAACVSHNKVNCAAPLRDGSKIVYGTDDGVYTSDMRTPLGDPVRVISLPDVTQLSILEEDQLLIIMSRQSVVSISLNVLGSSDHATLSVTRAKPISVDASFIKTGQCLDRTMVCVVEARPFSSTITLFVPIHQKVGEKQKAMWFRREHGGKDKLAVFKEFAIPHESTSVHFVKRKLCISKPDGFEIVDLESLETQPLLDPADASLDFVQKNKSLRPVALYKIRKEFLLCYTDFAFYVNKAGSRSRGNWIVHWEGNPTGFGFQYPYVLAFDEAFIEIRHVETGNLVQTIAADNMRCLFAHVPPPFVDRGVSNRTRPQDFSGGLNFIFSSFHNGVFCVKLAGPQAA